MRRLAALICSLSLSLLATGCGGGLVSVDTTGPDRPPEVPLVESTVYAADGSVIATLGVEHRSTVERDQLPQVLVDAVVAAEDRRFWTHGGVDARGIARAWAANNAAGDVVQGGSTITQR